MVSGKELIKKDLLHQISEDVLESSYGGLDSRPFDSTTFLNGPFHFDYKRIIDNDVDTSINVKDFHVDFKNEDGNVDKNQTVKRIDTVSVFESMDQSGKESVTQVTASVVSV